MSNKLRAAIVGTGKSIGFSRAHLMGYLRSQHAELTGIYDIDLQAARDWRKAFQLGEDVVCYESFSQLLENSDIVSICTPNFTHVDLVCQCLEKNVNVLCEKPLSNGMEGLDRLEAALAKTKAKGMVNLNYRHIPALRRLREMAAAGELGQVYLYRHTLGGNRFANESVGMEWRLRQKESGSGVIGDFCSHSLDMMHFILGEEQSVLSNLRAEKNTFIKERQGRRGPERVENEDSVMAMGTLPGGGLCSLMASRVGAWGNRLEIVGAKAIVRFASAEPARLYLTRREIGGAYGPEEAVDVPVDNPDWLTPGSAPEMLACAENVLLFARAVKENLPVPTDMRYGMRLQAELEALVQACEKRPS